MAKTSGDFFVWTPQSFATSAGSNHDVVVTSSLLIVSPTNDLDAITGFLPPLEASGGGLIVSNGHATNTLILLHNTGSQAGHRIILPQGATQLKLLPGQRVQMVYILGLGFRTGRDGVFNAPSTASAGPVDSTAAVLGAVGWGYASAAQADSIVTLLNQLRDIAVADGKMT